MSSFRNWLRGKESFSTKKQAEDVLNSNISPSIALNLDYVSKLFSEIPELIIRTFPLKSKKGATAALIYIECLVDKVVINEDILRPLLFQEGNEKDFWQSAVSVGNIEKLEKWSDIEQGILQGKSILFVDGELTALGLETQGAPKREIQEPITETSLNSSHEGFNEIASQSIALIRRYIPNRELKVKDFMVGERASTKVSVLYLADVASEESIKEMEYRIQSIKIDAVLSTGILEELVEDSCYTPFPQFAMTERPDTTAHHLLEGRIAVVVDRSPGVLIGPMRFTDFFQTIDDYSFRSVITSFLRILRFTAFFIAIFAPALYIALISFHYEVLPLKLLLTIGASRAKIPFPPLLEALIMELVLEMLREAAIRLPGPIGQTIGVVGGIVVGQAAVQAGIVSNIMVIVVSITAISSFIIPNLSMASGMRLLRFPMMIISSIFGMTGIVVGMNIIIIHLLSLKSLGSPYSSPISPLNLLDIADAVIRLPRKIMKKRPLSIGLQQVKRQGDMKESRDKK